MRAVPRDQEERPARLVPLEGDCPDQTGQIGEPALGSVRTITGSAEADEQPTLVRATIERVRERDEICWKLVAGRVDGHVTMEQGEWGLHDGLALQGCDSRGTGAVEDFLDQSGLAYSRLACYEKKCRRARLVGVDGLLAHSDLLLASH